MGRKHVTVQSSNAALAALEEQVRELQVILTRARKVQGEERAFVLRVMLQILEDLRRLASFLIADLEPPDEQWIQRLP